MLTFFDVSVSVQLCFHFYSALKEASEYVDYLFVKFYDNYCHTGDQKSFLSTLDKWLSIAPNGPLIFVGLPADTWASSDDIYYRSPGELKVIYEVC